MAEVYCQFPLAEVAAKTPNREQKHVISSDPLSSRTWAQFVLQLLALPFRVVFVDVRGPVGQSIDWVGAGSGQPCTGIVSLVAHVCGDLQAGTKWSLGKLPISSHGVLNCHTFKAGVLKAKGVGASPHHVKSEVFWLASGEAC